MEQKQRSIRAHYFLTNASCHMSPQCVTCLRNENSKHIFKPILILMYCVALIRQILEPMLVWFYYQRNCSVNSILRKFRIFFSCQFPSSELVKLWITSLFCLPNENGFVFWASLPTSFGTFVSSNPTQAFSYGRHIEHYLWTWIF